MNTGTYKNVAINGDGRIWWIAGCLQAGKFATLADIKRYIDENLWACHRNAGG